MVILVVIVVFATFLAFLPAAFRLRSHCLATRRWWPRWFFAAWFVLLSGLLFRGSWEAMTEDTNDYEKELILYAVAGVSGISAIVFATLGMFYVAPTFWPALQRRYLAPFVDATWAAHAGELRGPAPLSLLLVLVALLSITWLTLIGFYPWVFAPAKHDRPVEWLQATIEPSSVDPVGSHASYMSATTIEIQTDSGRWIRVASIPSSKPLHLAILSPDAVLVLNVTSDAAHDTVWRGNTGAVYVKGSAVPKTIIPESEDIAPLPSGGLLATRCAPIKGCRDESCPNCAHFVVERYDASGELTARVEWPLPPNAVQCDWWPARRVLGEAAVYEAQHCPRGSHGDGFYAVSANRVERITSRMQISESTYLDDRHEMEGKSQRPGWYAIPWRSHPHLP